MREVSALKSLAKKYPSRYYGNKDERWALIAQHLPGRKKRECYEKYKQLRRKKCQTSSNAKRSASVSSSPAPAFQKPDPDFPARTGSFSAAGIPIIQGASRGSILRVKHPPAVIRHTDDLEVSDIEDDVERYGANRQHEVHSKTAAEKLVKPLLRAKSEVISTKQAKALRTVLFGERRPNCFNESWRQQGFCFAQIEGLRYGLVQNTGGPCGVLAVVQAVFLKHLLFISQGKCSADANLEVSNSRRDELLVEACAEIIWRCRPNEKADAVVAIQKLSSRIQQPDRALGYRPDGFTENMQLYRLTTHAEVVEVLQFYLLLFKERKGFGVVMFVYSCLLSRGVSTDEDASSIYEDFDAGMERNEPLIGNCNYASQELVNLLLTGRAVSNVFDGDKQLDTGSNDDDGLILRGIPSQADIGFLTLFEHYDCMQVGQRYKCPRQPIWVVCSESHYSVLFATDEDIVDDFPFNIFYYDQLGMQEDSIRLTIDPHPDYMMEGKTNMEDPPLESVIRTKWPGASIDWNDSEVIY